MSRYETWMLLRDWFTALETLDICTASHSFAWLRMASHGFAWLRMASHGFGFFCFFYSVFILSIFPLCSVALTESREFHVAVRRREVTYLDNDLRLSRGTARI